MASPSHNSPVTLATLFYLPMVASAAFVTPPGVFRVEAWQPLALGLALALVIGMGTVIWSRMSGRRTGWGRAMRMEIRRLLGRLGPGEILVLSLFSAFGEEILFRGVLQGRIGLLATALLFGLLHFPYRRAMVPWTVFAVVLGLVLGALTEGFGSLWPAIWLHFVVNYFNLHDLMAPPEPGEPPDREPL